MIIDSWREGGPGMTQAGGRGGPGLGGAGRDGAGQGLALMQVDSA